MLLVSQKFQVGLLVVNDQSTVPAYHTIRSPLDRTTASIVTLYTAPDIYNKLTPRKTETTATAVKRLSDRAGDAALDVRFDPVLVAETATTEPIVGEGATPFTSFSAVAVDESVAKPTDGGLNLKTEYTFF